MTPRNRHPRIPKSVVTKALKEYDAGENQWMAGAFVLATQPT